MCDYSLHGKQTRLAVEGETLFVYRFSTGSKGMMSEADAASLRKILPAPAGATFIQRAAHFYREARRVFSGEAGGCETAVCLPPGAVLELSGLSSRLQSRLGVGESARVTFAQISKELGRYRDAVVFPNGESLLLQHLDEGMIARVVSLELAEAEPVEQRADEIIIHLRGERREMAVSR